MGLLSLTMYKERENAYFPAENTTLKVLKMPKLYATGSLKTCIPVGQH